MDYAQALCYIHSISWRGSRPGLSRITQLLSLLGEPQRDLRCIHVAGTNGKGSFCAMTAAILQAAGYRTGLFTSPYIQRFNERICVDGRPIADDDLARLTARIQPVAEGMADPPTEFELITALAFLYFQQQGCQVVVLEAGMGGRLDSTNVIPDPLLTVVTGVALDHMAYLGDTIPAIAREKAGIFKPGRPALYGERDETAAAVLRQRAEQIGAPFFQVDAGRLTHVQCTLDGCTLDFGPLQQVALPLLGLYQPQNAATVLTAISLLRQGGLSLPEAAVRRGLAQTRWPGRFERLRRRPVLLFDGSHNVQGAAAARDSLRHYFPHRPAVLLCGVMADKQYDEMAALFAGTAARAFTVTPDNPRALASEELAWVFAGQGIPAESWGRDVPGALAAALALARARDLPVLAMGSLYLYAAVRQAADALPEET